MNVPDKLLALPGLAALGLLAYAPAIALADDSPRPAEEATQDQASEDETAAMLGAAPTSNAELRRGTHLMHENRTPDADPVAHDTTTHERPDDDHKRADEPSAPG